MATNSIGGRRNLSVQMSVQMSIGLSVQFVVLWPDAEVDPVVRL